MHSPLHPSGVGCCAFLRRPFSLSRLGYRPLPLLDAPDGGSAGCCSEVVEQQPVRVVVGKERCVFFVDPFLLQRDPFRILIAAAGNERSRPKGAIFVDVDAILFEHMLWLVHHDRSSSASFFQLNLKEIIEFYSQDN